MLPLVVNGALWGMIGMDDVRQPRQWGEDEIVVLRTAAEMFSSTLHRWKLEDRLRAQAASDATQAERQRLAQDLHDVITQTLYGLTLMARTGREALREGDAEGPGRVAGRHRGKRPECPARHAHAAIPTWTAGCAYRGWPGHGA